MHHETGVGFIGSDWKCCFRLPTAFRFLFRYWCYAAAASNAVAKNHSGSGFNLLYEACYSQPNSRRTYLQLRASRVSKNPTLARRRNSLAAKPYPLPAAAHPLSPFRREFRDGTSTSSSRESPAPFRDGGHRNRVPAAPFRSRRRRHNPTQPRHRRLVRDAGDSYLVSPPEPR